MLIQIVETAVFLVVFITYLDYLNVTDESPEAVILLLRLIFIWAMIVILIGVPWIIWSPI